MPIRRKGSYLGTEVDGKWWRRLRGGLLMRGLGEYWYDETSFFFLRHLTRKPIEIRFSDMREITLGKWHSGKWAAGQPVMKIIWIRGGEPVSSGFVLSGDNSESEKIAAAIRQIAGAARS